MKLFLIGIPFLLLANAEYISDDANNYCPQNVQDTLKSNGINSFEIYNGDTINRRNEHGYRVGIWYRFPDSTSNLTYKYYFSGETGELSDRVWSEIYYPNGIMKSRLNQNRDTTWYFNEQGNLDMILIGENYNESRILSYYPNGMKKSECFYSRHDPSNIGTDLDSCWCWTETGVPIINCP